MEVGLRSRCAAPRPASPVTWSRDAGFQPRRWRLLPPRCLLLAFWPATLPWLRVSVLVLCLLGRVRMASACAGAGADDGDLVAVGAAVSVSLRSTRVVGWRFEIWGLKVRTLAGPRNRYARAVGYERPVCSSAPRIRSPQSWGAPSLSSLNAPRRHRAWASDSKSRFS